MSGASVNEATTDVQRFRHVMGSFASGVVVVTAQAQEGPVGITCQSFVSLSLDPPLVLFCPAKSSWAWQQIRAAGHFCVNILDEAQQELGLRFASRIDGKFQGMAFASSPSGAPLFDDVSAWIDCGVHAVYDGGDHDVVVGSVLELEVDLGRRPLVYHRGEFGKFSGDPLVGSPTTTVNHTRSLKR